MTNTEPDAWSTIAEGEEVFDLRLEGGVVEKGNNSVMVWSHSYQVVKPGGHAAARYR